MTCDYGKITWHGEIIRLTGEATCDNYGTDGRVRYYAPGVGEDGRTVRVAWEEEYAGHRVDASGRCSVDDCKVNHDDGDNACDWDDPVEVVDVG